MKVVHFVERQVRKRDRTRCSRLSLWLTVTWFWQYVTCKQCLKRRSK